MFDPLLKKLQHYTDLGKKEVSVLRAAPERTQHLDKGEYIISEGSCCGTHDARGLGLSLQDALRWP